MSDDGMIGINRESGYYYFLFLLLEACGNLLKQDSCPVQMDPIDMVRNHEVKLREFLVEVIVIGGGKYVFGRGEGKR